MNNDRADNKNRTNGMPPELRPISSHSDLGRWIAAQEWTPKTLEAALADFCLLLRMGNN